MQANNFGFFSARGVGRVVVEVFVICVLAVSGLTWGGSDVGGKIKVDPRSPINPENLEGLEMLRLDISPKFTRLISYYCGSYSYDAAWAGYIGGQYVCMIYKANGNEFWLIKGDLFIPLSTDIIFLSLKVGEHRFIYFSCDEDVLRCANPLAMPPTSGLDITGDDDLVIETVVAESADVEPEGISRLRSRISSMPNLSWFAKLCYVTDTLSYSDNCEDKHASPKNFAIRIADLDTRNSFTLTRYWDSTDRSDPAGFGSTVYLRDIGTTSPVEVSCDISEAGFSTSYLEGYHIYSCLGHTLKFEGNFVVLGSDANAAASGGIITPLPKPKVRVIAMEVTQGLQNWENTVTLVKDRRTAVRVFMETNAIPRKITATLEGTKIRGSVRTNFTGEPPVNRFQKVEVRPNIVEHRKNIDSSLNFILPDIWTNIREDEKLELRLVFDEDNIECNDLCTTQVNFTEVTSELKFVMIPLKVKNKNKYKSESEAHPGMLKEQFLRLMSILPLPNSEYITLDKVPKKTHEAQFRLFPIVNRKNAVIYYTDILEAFQADGPGNFLYLGVLPGEQCVHESIYADNPNRFDEDEKCPGKGDKEEMPPGGIVSRIPKNSQRPGGAASWYTGGDYDGLGLRSITGYRRNSGGHEVGHLLGQEHPIRDRSEKNEKGFYDGTCGEHSSATEIYPYYEYKKVGKKEGENVYNWLPTLGPLGDARTEIWGLDIRYIKSWNYNFKNLSTISPYEALSIMSYCYLSSPGYHQGRWMDVHHHEKIIQYLKSLDGRYLTSADAVTSDLFSGSVIFSSNGEVLGAELDSVFSRPRRSLPTEENGFNLELRDLSGSVIRNIPFGARIHPHGNRLEGTVSVNFSIIVPSPPRYDSIAVTKDGIEIEVFERSFNSPVLSVIGPPPNEFYNHNDIINIDWESSDADGDDLLYRVYYSTDGGVNYQILSLDTEETSMSIRAGLLAGSDNARIGVSVSDGTRSTFAETPIFSVAGNVPEVSIESPDSGSVISSEQVIVLDAFGYDREDGYLGSSAFSWRSSLDGNLGQGQLLVVAASDLSFGEHVITATATDSDQMTASASATLTVNARNTAPLAVDDAASAAFGKAVQIDVLANDIDLENDTDLNTLAIYEQPALGTAKIITSPNGRPVVEYISSNQGTDVFSYEICDYGDRCDTAQITVAVVVEDCTITGTDGDDILRGTSGDDVICGLGGDDSIDGRSGNDTIYGGPGDDTIYARAGDDIVHGGLGNDLILGHRGDDIIYGSLGDDIAYGGEGNDWIIGGEGDDELYGEADDDRLEGNDGDDKIHGGRGDDIIWGDQGNDTIRGNTGKDTITPGPGENTILGTTPDDTIY